MSRPRSTLDNLKGAMVPKEGEEPAAAPTPAAVPAPSLLGEPPQAYAHTLSLRLTAKDYRRLRHFVTRAEEKTGARLTHQAILVAALADFLDKEGA